VPIKVLHCAPVGQLMRVSHLVPVNGFGQEQVKAVAPVGIHLPLFAQGLIRQAVLVVIEVSQYFPV